MPGASNDINVLNNSILLSKTASGTYPLPFKYTINGQEPHIPYWLSDGIYPKWPRFVHFIAEPGTAKEKFFSTRQESERKDVERALGILQAKWYIVARPAASVVSTLCTR